MAKRLAPDSAGKEAPAGEQEGLSQRMHELIFGFKAEERRMRLNVDGDGVGAARKNRRRTDDTENESES